MEVTKTLRVVEHENTYPDVLKISLKSIPVPADMHEVQFIRTHGKSTRKEKFYLSAEDMIQFESVLVDYNRNFIDLSPVL